MARTAFILAKIGGLFLIIGGGLWYSALIALYLLIALLSESVTGLRFDALFIGQTITIVLGILTLKARKRMKRGVKNEAYMLLIIGGIAAIGPFIPIAPTQIFEFTGSGVTFPLPQIMLSTALVAVDPYLIICAAIIALLEVKQPGEVPPIEKKEKKKLTEKELEKEKIRKEREEIKKEREALKEERKALKKEKEALAKEKDVEG